MEHTIRMNNIQRCACKGLITGHRLHLPTFKGSKLGGRVLHVILHPGVSCLVKAFSNFLELRGMKKGFVSCKPNGSTYSQDWLLKHLRHILSFTQFTPQCYET